MLEKMKVLSVLLPLIFVFLTLLSCEGSDENGEKPINREKKISVEGEGIDTLSPKLCLGGQSKLYVVWYDNRRGNYDIFLNASIDGGKTWKISDVKVNQQESSSDPKHQGNPDSFNPEIACDVNNIYVVWEDYRSGYSDIYMNYSSDNGDTWLATDIRLDTDENGEGNSMKPKVALAGNKVYVVWYDNRNGAYDIYFNYSTDGTDFQEEDIRVDKDEEGTAHSESPEISADGAGRVAIVWQDVRSGLSDIYYNYSENNGSSNSWLSSDVRVDTDSPAAGNSFAPKLSLSGGKVSIVWHDDRNGLKDIYFNYSTDGKHFQSTDFRLDTDQLGLASSLYPRIRVTGENIYVVWCDAREGADGTNGYDILFRFSKDSGVTWNSDVEWDQYPDDPELMLNTNEPGSSNSLYPMLDSDSEGHIITAWTDSRYGEYNVYYNYSADGGLSFQDEDILLTTNEPGESFAENINVKLENENAYFVWCDWRDGSSDIYFKRETIREFATGKKE